jgi:hypothetical protein
MSYTSIAQAAQSQELRARVAACVAQEAGEGLPYQTVDLIQWKCAAEPGWGEAWESALAARDITDPTPVGNDPAVITDAMILSAVQKHLAEPPGKGSK